MSMETWILTLSSSLSLSLFLIYILRGFIIKYIRIYPLKFNKHVSNLITERIFFKCNKDSLMRKFDCKMFKRKKKEKDESNLQVAVSMEP